MVRKLIRQMLYAQIFSALTVSLCLLIDSVMIGRFLGVGALSSYQLANPILLIVAAFASMLASGIQVVCSRSLGKGSQEETNAGYSTAIVLGMGVSLVMTILILIFCTPIATAIGAGREGQLFEDTRDYMRGFIIGAPATMGAMILVPFLQIAGQSGLLVAAVLVMTIADVVLDLLNVLVLHGGMFGMGLVSSLSYYCALLVGGRYFFTKKCVFRFSFRLVTRAKMLELLKSGIPTLVNLVACMGLVLVLNQLLLNVGGSIAVAAFSVVTTIGNAGNCINTGISGVSLTLAGIFYSEEDRTSLKELVQQLSRYCVVLGLIVGVILAALAIPFASLFITEAGEARAMAVNGIRFYATGMIPCCLVGALKNSYQATDREKLTELISVLEQLVFPVLAAWVFSRFMGVNGAWTYYPLGELLTLITIGVFIRVRSKKVPWRDGAFLLLHKTFGVPADQLMEVNIQTVEEAVRISKDAENFCRKRGQSPRISSHIALCIEEMAANIIEHGFTKDHKPHQLSIRLLHKKDCWVIRFRDDCRAFDPVHYIPGEGKDALGIRLMLALAEDAQYTYSLNMNNLMLRLPDEKRD